MKNRFSLLTLAVLATASQVAMAGPFTGATSAADDTSTLMASVAAILGGLITLIGGGLAAWKAVHHEPWTKPLIFAIIGAAIAAVSV